MKEKIYRETEEKMKKTVENFKKELSKIRTGKANPALLESISVEYYGVNTPLNQLSNISTPDMRSFVIQPWDKSAISAIEKAIQKANIGLNPNSDGNIIRLQVPALTEETRKDIIKNIKRITEDNRVAARNVRRESMETLKNAKTNGEMPEDDEKRLEKDIQKLTDDYIGQMDELLVKKEKDILDT
ncbi:ribosome recycling factor [candidate division WOR-3 bacterium]|nr:ribosome recycling factor [candidate division WOR-3 bacterium]